MNYFQSPSLGRNGVFNEYISAPPPKLWMGVNPCRVSCKGIQLEGIKLLIQHIWKYTSFPADHWD